MVTILITFIMTNIWGLLGFFFFMATMHEMIDFVKPLRPITVAYYFLCGPWIWTAMLLMRIFP